MKRRQISMKSFSKLLPAIKKNVVVPIVSVLALAILVGFVAYEATKQEVNVTHNGETEAVVTRANTVADVLDELNIEVGEQDRLSHELEDSIVADMHIEYIKAKRLSLVIDQEEETYYTTKETVGDFFEEINLSVSEHDDLSVDLETPIEEDLSVTLDQALKVVVNDADEEEEVWTTERTIEAFLKEQDIELGELDRLEPSKEEEIDKDTTVTITRVEEVTDTKEEVIDFSTVRRNDSSLEQGTEEVIASGSDGLLERTYKVTLENGKEVERELVSEEVKKESEQRVVAVGTKVIEQTVSRGGSSSSSNTESKETSSDNDVLYMEATAYNWDCGSCSGTGRTATGYNVKANPDGVIAVDPSVIPLGTKVYVEGYGYAVARDTGGAIQGNKIDLHMRTVEEARQFGRQRVKVEIIE